MSSYIDLKFIDELSLRLSQFKKKGDYLFNFRCPHCGDSKKSKTKARAYFYRIKNDMFFKCHNCGEGQNLQNFIKYIDPSMSERYNGDVFAFQGRAFGKEQPKYLTIKLDDTKDKIYGLENLNLQQHIHIVEGPIDSMFIDNSIACAGADLKFDRVTPENITYIFDNEPRNKEIVKRMYDIVEEGFNLVVWPDDMRHKDINDLIISGMSKNEVSNLISTNTYSKLEAVAKLNYFKKCN